MFNSFKDLKNFRVRAADEPEGSVDDIYFDDATWSVRYLVVNIGFWLFGRQCLVGVERLGKPDLPLREFPVDLTAEELKQAPVAEADPPVGAQERRASMRAWPPYMIGTAGMGYTPMLAEEQIARERMANQMPAPEESGDPHLRSMAEVDGYEIAASDGEIGTVADFLINPLDWRVRYLVIDTGNWLPGKKVIVATGWISDVDWSNQRVSLEINRHKVETSPDMDTVPSLQRSDEARLFEHYGAVPYWTA